MKISKQRLREIIREELTEACWKGYKQVGMKEKDGKQVPNCVPIKEGKLKEGKFYAWIPGKRGKLVVNAKDLSDAKKQVVSKYKVPMTNWGLIAILSQKAYYQQQYRFEGKLTEGGRFKLSGASEMQWGGNKIIIMTGKGRIVLDKKELKNMLRGLRMHHLADGVVKEDFGHATKQIPAFSSKEAKKVVDDGLNMCKVPE